MELLLGVWKERRQLPSLCPNPAEQLSDPASVEYDQGERIRREYRASQSMDKTSNVAELASSLGGQLSNKTNPGKEVACEGRSKGLKVEVL